MSKLKKVIIAIGAVIGGYFLISTIVYAILIYLENK